MSGDLTPQGLTTRPVDKVRWRRILQTIILIVVLLAFYLINRRFLA